jgi:hypothetical protein
VASPLLVNLSCGSEWPELLLLLLLFFAPFLDDVSIESKHEVPLTCVDVEDALMDDMVKQLGRTVRTKINSK